METGEGKMIASVIYARILHTIEKYNVSEKMHSKIGRMYVDICVQIMLNKNFILNNNNNNNIEFIISCAILFGSKGAGMVFIPNNSIHVVFGDGGLWSRVKISSHENRSSMIASILSANILSEIVRQTVGSIDNALFIASLASKSCEINELAIKCSKNALRERAFVRVQQLAFGLGLGWYNNLNETMGGLIVHMYISRLLEEDFLNIAVPYLEYFEGIEQRHDILVDCLAWCFDIPSEIMERLIFFGNVGDILTNYMSPSRCKCLNKILMDSRPSTTFFEWCRVHLKWRDIIGYDINARSRIVILRNNDETIVNDLLRDMIDINCESLNAVRVVLEHSGHTLAPARLRGYIDTDMRKNRLNNSHLI